VLAAAIGVCLNRVVLASRRNSGHWRCGRSWAARLVAVCVLAAAAALTLPPPAALAATTSATRAARPTASARAASGTVLPAHAWGADLVDAGTGAQLWGKDAGIPRPMGSITKVMAALVVLRDGDLGREIRVTNGAVQYVDADGASSAGLIAGDVLTARQLLEAMLLPSGCDAAYMLATAYGPGRSAFVRKMNVMAMSMGLTATHFAGFDGMPHPTEYSTYSSPADLVRIGERAMRNSVFRGIVSQSSFYLPATNLHRSYLWYSTDELLGSYPGDVGIKTGNTQAAGYCLLFEARRGRRVLIGVVLHADPADDPYSSFTAAAQLLDWGFSQI